MLAKVLAVLVFCSSFDAVFFLIWLDFFLSYAALILFNVPRHDLLTTTKFIIISSHLHVKGIRTKAQETEREWKGGRMGKNGEILCALMKSIQRFKLNY